MTSCRGALAVLTLDWQGTRLLPDRQNALTWMVRKTDMPIQKLSPEIITAAILGFEEQKRNIDSKITELRAMLPGGPGETASTPEVPTPKRRKFSAAARRRMKEAQQRRWAKIKGESEPAAPAKPVAPKPKRKLSAAGRKAIQDALRRRWAQKRADAAEKTARKKGAAKKAAKKPGRATVPAVAQPAG